MNPLSPLNAPQCPPAILVVDDEPDNFDVIEALLSQETYDLYYAPSAQQALNQLDDYRPDVILLDVMMPDMDGIEFCRHLRQQPRWQSVPIIMVTALTDKSDLAACIAAGADDFISKPVSGIELQARLRSMLRIRRQYQSLEAFNRELENAVQQRTAALYERIFQDPLTQLPSRAFLLQHLQGVLQDPDHPFALVYLGCDQFKLINGSLGHDIGDQLLVEIARRLNTLTGPNDFLARTDAEEFCFFLDRTTQHPAVLAFVQRVMQSFEAPFAVAGFEIYVTACLGITFRDETYTQPQEPLQDADTAMYQARLRGKGSHQVFDSNMHRRFMERLTLENDLRRALERQEFVNHYQPIVNLQSGAIVGFEALVRWQHPQLGMIAPDTFIPCMEETGLIVPVGMLVLQMACQQLKQWHQAGWPELTVSVNLSVRQFSHPTLISDIDQILATADINPRLLRLEITESALMEDAQAAVDLTGELRLRQMQLSIDDFGTGYSSLGYLNQLPLDSLKIDQAFVAKITAAGYKPEILHAIVGLGRALELNLIAEGIETPQQLTYLQSLGVQYGQGYLFGKPLSAADTTALLCTNL